MVAAGVRRHVLREPAEESRLLLGLCQPLHVRPGLRPPSLIGGKLSDRTGRRKIFVLTASVVYGLALFVIAVASNFSGFLVGMAIGGLGFRVYVAVGPPLRFA